MKLKRSLNSWLAILAAILLAVPAGRAQSADNPIPIRISAGESVTLERAAAKGEDVFELTAQKNILCDRPIDSASDREAI